MTNDLSSLQINNTLSALLASLSRPYVNKPPPTGNELIDRVKQIALLKIVR